MSYHGRRARFSSDAAPSSAAITRAVPTASRAQDRDARRERDSPRASASSAVIVNK